MEAKERTDIGCTEGAHGVWCYSAITQIRIDSMIQDKTYIAYTKKPSTSRDIETIHDFISQIFNSLETTFTWVLVLMFSLTLPKGGPSISKVAHNTTASIQRCIICDDSLPQTQYCN